MIEGILYNIKYQWFDGFIELIDGVKSAFDITKNLYRFSTKVICHFIDQNECIVHNRR